MIKIVQNIVKKTSPYYKLYFDYMIGDAKGYITEEITVSIDNPFTERFVKLLNSLKPIEGRWGIVFSTRVVGEFLKEKQITEDDYYFLMAAMFESSPKDRYTEEEKDYIYDFCEGIKGETEYSFLVFQGVTLIYRDEYGIEHNTIIED